MESIGRLAGALELRKNTVTNAAQPEKFAAVTVLLQPIAQKSLWPWLIHASKANWRAYVSSSLRLQWGPPSCSQPKECCQRRRGPITRYQQTGVTGGLVGTQHPQLTSFNKSSLLGCWQRVHRKSYHQHINEQQVLVRMWQKGKPHAFLVGIQIGAATAESSMKLP